MASHSLTCISPAISFSLHNNNIKIQSLSLLRSRLKPLNLAPSSTICDPLSGRFAFRSKTTTSKKGRGFGAVCYSAPLSHRSLLWISTISSAVLMVTKGTAIQKPFLVPLLAIQAPASIVAWIRGEYGIWTAFLALLVRLFFFIPDMLSVFGLLLAELDLPFLAFLLVILAPHRVMNLRGTKEGALASLMISGYLAFQHFSRSGSLQKSFDLGSIVATVSIICTSAVSLVLLF